MFPAHCLCVLHECVRGPELRAALLTAAVAARLWVWTFLFSSGPSLRFLVQGEGGDRGTESCPRGFMEGLPADSHPSLCGLMCFTHANTVLPACVHACVHVPVHASPLDASLAAGAGASVGMSRGASVQLASILPQVLLTFSLPPNSSWT